MFNLYSDSSECVICFFKSFTFHGGMQVHWCGVIKITTVKYQAARALANLAAHGDSNSNNAAVGQEAGALEALVQLTRSPHEGVR